MKMLCIVDFVCTGPDNNVLKKPQFSTLDKTVIRNCDTDIKKEKYFPQGIHRYGKKFDHKG